MSTDNLDHTKAIHKLKDLIKDIKVGMLLTDVKKTPISAVPMTTKKVDDDGTIWFLSGLSSEHNTNIAKNAKVQMLYSHPGDMKFLSVYGKADIVTDKDILSDLYSKVDDAWFTGKEDPNLTAIKVTPQEAYYWDTKTNKYVSLFKIGISALNGGKADIGKKGKLEL
ncbi:MAG: pyridoxamine 5'-phosphate oxidase family protein [Gillisia sp.]